ncbi:hypothetical protein [Paenibacillus qinlingensis]|uniref:Uncharacterized protein n=1 Tax=Paenibacillus qinlingensis TaxID=1837343 RepID=A0ABU1P3A7_9BACL|nr:hypothetical protein [Paenibacillus qinlingensis]MDR6554223.1 hypothetical protein [Paenibacillus qinlingensis]
MKALKSKLAIGFVATGLVAGMGTAFAATDAGAQLQSWYTTASTAAKLAIAGDFGTYYLNKTKALDDNVDSGLNAARVNIKTTGEAELAGVNNAIGTQNSAYLNQITNKKTSISNSIGAEYDDVVNTTNAVTNGSLLAIGIADTIEITNGIKNHEAVYTNRLNDGVKITSDAAVAELSANIIKTKADLEALLATEKTNATAEVKANLDTKISALQTKLAELTTQLQTAAQGKIVARADVLEADALKKLDDIVKNIK